MNCVFEVVVRLISKAYGQQLHPDENGFRRRLPVVVRTAISLQTEDGGRISDLKCLSFGVLRD